jgi:hypothetical protein
LLVNVNASALAAAVVANSAALATRNSFIPVLHLLCCPCSCRLRPA